MAHVALGAADLTGQSLKVAVVGHAANLSVTFPGKTEVDGPFSFNVEKRVAGQQQRTVLSHCQRYP